MRIRKSYLNLAGVLLAAGVIVGGAGYAAYTYLLDVHDREVHARLSSIMELKIRQIRDWRDERVSDARYLYSNERIHLTAYQFIGSPKSAALKISTEKWMRSMFNNGRYVTMAFFDNNGRPRAILGNDEGVDTESARAFVLKARSLRTIVFSDFEREAGEMFSLNIAVPFSLELGGDSLPSGTVLLRINPYRVLFPSIQQWPVPTKTGETLLGRREDDSVRILNDPRFLQSAHLPSMLPLSQTQSPLVQAALGRTGIVTGLDREDVPVIAAVGRVPDTDWFLVVKMDVSEAHETTRLFGWLIGALCIVTVLAVAAAARAQWNAASENYYRQLFESEQIRKKNEEWLRLYFELPFIGMAVTSPETKKWLRMNQRLCDIFGYSREELEKKTWTEITHPDDIAKDVAEFERVMRGEMEGYTLEKRFIRKGGAVIHAIIDVKCIRKPDKTVDFFVATIQDITERKRTEQLLRDSEEKYRLLFEKNPLPMWVYDLETLEFLDVNDAAIEHYGYTREEFLSMTIMNIRPPEDIPALLDNVDKIRNGLSASGIWRHYTKAGDLIDVEITSYALSYNGRPAELILSNDVTERLTAERELRIALQEKERVLEQLRLHIDRMPFGYVVTDRFFRFRFINSAAERMFGYTNTELQGRDPYAIIIPESAREHVESLRKQWMKGSMAASGTNENLTKDGRVILCEWTNIPIFDEQGEFESLFSMVTEVTERERTQQQLKRTLGQLRTLSVRLQHVREEERAAVARDIHDELGQVLTALKIDLSVIEKDIGSKTSADELLSEVRGMRELVDNAIGTTRRIIRELKPEALETGGLPMAVKVLAEGLGKRMGWRIKLDIDPPTLKLPSEVSLALFRAVQEALNNTAKHASANNVRIGIRSGGGIVKINVEDDGKGYQEEDLRKSESTGLVGMRERLLPLGGEVRLRHRQEGGTILDIFVPLTSDEQQKER